MSIFPNHSQSRCRQSRQGFVTVLLMCITLAFVGNASAQDAAAGQSTPWEIIKMSGDAWISSDKPEPISLTKGMALKNGDKLRTGRNGRILLKRGEETIMVTPNSAIALPAEHPGKGNTQILQQAGEILLEVEKRNVKHFEVATPYLAAVVKGTRFRVKVDGNGANVSVERGKVEVMDLKSGKFVLIKPGQNVSLAKDNKNGLQLGGTGTREKIRQGTPRPPLVKPIEVNINRAMQRAENKPGKKAAQKARPVKRITRTRTVRKMRIGRALGQVKLNVATSTKGLVRPKNNTVTAGKKQKTVWAKLNKTNKSNNGNGNNNGNNSNGGLNIGGGNNGNNGNNSGGGLALGLSVGGGDGGGLGLGLGVGGGGGIGIGVTGGLPPGLGGIPPGLAKKLGL